MKRLLLCALMVGLIGAAPTTRRAARRAPSATRPAQPATTRSIYGEIHLARQAQEDAEAKVELERALAVRRVRETPEYVAVAADLAAKESALLAARRSGTPQAKLDASGAAVKARARLKELEAAAVDDPALLAAQSAAADAALAVHRLVAAAEDAERADPNNIAIQRGEIVVGMTLEQADRAMEVREKLSATEGVEEMKRELVDQTARTQTYEWSFYALRSSRAVRSGELREGATLYAPPATRHRLFAIVADFEDGRVAGITKVRRVK